MKCMAGSQSGQDRKQCLCQSLDTAMYISLFMCSAIHAWIHSCIHSFIFHSFMHSFGRLFIHAFIRSFTHSFIHSFIHSSVHSFTNLPNHCQISKVVRAKHCVLFTCSQQRTSRAAGCQHRLPGQRCRCGQAGHDPAAHTAAPSLPCRHLQTAPPGDRTILL